MKSKDFVSVIVPLNDLEKKIYRDIVVGAGLNEPTVVDISRHPIHNNKIKKYIAKLISRVVGKKKAVIVGRKHYNIAFCYNRAKAALVTFDAHTDDEFCDWDIPVFHDGSFIRYRKGTTYVLGSEVSPLSSRTKVYKPKNIQAILEADLPRDIFLSLEVDVFNASVTTAHNWPHSGLDEAILKLIGIEKHLAYKPVLELSKRLISNRNVVGINLAGYDPQLEKEDPKTAELLTQYLKAIIN